MIVALQAVKEIGNRLVIATFLVQGKDEKGEIKKPPVKKIFSPKPKKGEKKGKEQRRTRSLSIIENNRRQRNLPQGRTRKGKLRRLRGRRTGNRRKRRRNHNWKWYDV